MKPLLLIAAAILAAEFVRADEFERRFAVVMIDEKTEADLGPFPYDRAVLAKGVEACAHLGARAVVLKFFLDRSKSEPGDKALEESMRGIPVALQCRLDPAEGTPAPIPGKFGFGSVRYPTAVRGDRAWVPLPGLMDTATAVGFVDFAKPEIPLIEEYRGTSFKSLVLCCAELAFGDRATVDPGRIAIGNYFVRVDPSNVFHARIPRATRLAISYADLLSGNVDRSSLSGRVAIVGWDTTRTPRIVINGRIMTIHRFFDECVASLVDELAASNAAEPPAPANSKR